MSANPFDVLNPDEVPEEQDEGGVEAFDSLARALDGLEDEDAPAQQSLEDKLLPNATQSKLSRAQRQVGAIDVAVPNLTAPDRTVFGMISSAPAMDAPEENSKPSIKAGRGNQPMSRKQRARAEKAREKAETQESRYGVTNNVSRRDRKSGRKTRAKSNAAY